MGKLADLYINRTREYLKQQAMAIINKAQLYKQTGDITGAQYDSYGALIFYNGGLIYTFRITPGKATDRQKYYLESYGDEAGKHRGYAKWGIPDGTGPEWAEILRNEVKSGAWGKIPSQGFCLVVFNAAFYSQIHEKKQNYKILSMVASDMEKLQSEFKGSTLRWHNLNVK